jgi:tetratricopeptide (TPR) repeat protein
MGLFRKASQQDTSTKMTAEALQAEAAKQAVEALQDSKQTVQQAIKEVVDEMVAETRANTRAAVEQAVRAVEEKKAADAAVPVARPVRPEVRPHAFVVMPFGKKKGGDGALYDFNAIYEDLIKPTLESAGFEAFRADESTTSGDILTDMFQELLLADLVLADMSIDNANVFYELGIRHAFRKRGIVHIQAGRSYMPFDIFNVRTIPYHITAEGVPDPLTIDKDKQAIARVCRDTRASDPDAVHSPIFNLLTGLIEPERKTLRTPLATGFWREYYDWKDRVTIAKRRRRIGDILLLTEEITNPMIKEEAVGEAGKALQDMERLDLGLKQYQQGLEINPRNVKFRRQEAIFLNRLGRVEEAIVKLENLLADYPADTEAMGTLGRIYKDVWNNSWKWLGDDKEKRLKTAFEAYHWLVKAFQTYLKGYQFDLDNTYLGVNALTLGTTLLCLADRFEDKDDPDPDIANVREILPGLRSTLLFALEHKTFDEPVDYWDLASLGELQVNTADRTQKVTRAYRKALTAARGNLFSLESSMRQLETLCLLDMRTEYAAAGLKVIKDELRRIRKEEEGQPDVKTAHPDAKNVDGQVFLFTGYMVDYSRKLEELFPPGKESAFKDAICKILDKYKAGPDDLAFTAGMSGGCELIFVECCLERGIRVKAYMPIPEAQYVRDFVSVCGDNWVERFYKARNNPLCDEYYQPDNVGEVKPGDNIDERNNRWALYSSLERGMDKVRLIAVWDGKNEISQYRDARQVKHMVDLMRDMGGQIEHINPSKVLVQEVVKVVEKRVEKAPKARKSEE